MFYRIFFQRFMVVVALILSQGALASGQQKAAVCSACHGVDGNSINPAWPSLAGQGADYIVKQLQAYKSGSRKNGLMSPMAANLSEIDMKEIAAYFSQQSPKINFTSLPDTIAAGKIYRGGDKSKGIPACMACHGPNGAGNPAAKYPSLRGQHADYTENQLLSYRDRTRDTDQQMMMRSIAAKLSDEEITQLSKYVSALH